MYDLFPLEDDTHNKEAATQRFPRKPRQKDPLANLPGMLTKDEFVSVVQELFAKQNVNPLALVNTQNDLSGLLSHRQLGLAINIEKNRNFVPAYIEMSERIIKSARPENYCLPKQTPIFLCIYEASLADLFYISIYGLVPRKIINR